MTKVSVVWSRNLDKKPFYGIGTASFRGELMLSKKLFLASIVLFVLVTFPLIGSVGASLELWSQTYGGTGGDVAYSLVVTSDGGFALAGVSTSFGGFWLVKTDAEGNMLWNRTYGGKNIDIAYSLVEVSGDGFALAGYTSSLGDGSDDFWLVKTDAQGIPEFPSCVILPLLITATLLIIICNRKLPKTPSHQSY